MVYVTRVGFALSSNTPQNRVFKFNSLLLNLDCLVDSPAFAISTGCAFDAKSLALGVTLRCRLYDDSARNGMGYYVLFRV